MSIASIVKTTVQLPIETLTVGFEIIDIVGKTTLNGVRGTIPTAKGFSKSVGRLGTGMAHPDQSYEEVCETFDNLSFDDMLTALEKSAVKGAQSLSKAVREEPEA